MSLRLRLLLLMLAISVAGGYFITRWVIGQVRPRYLESIEESLVDTSVLLAATLETQSTSALDTRAVQTIYEAAARRHFSARIFSIEKPTIDLRVTVTDASGRVVFDSTGRDVGRDYSRWNDVARTLRGQYGARSTRDVPGDDNTQVLYVAAPVLRDGRITGVVSVGKPTRGINELLASAKRRILLGAATGGALLLVVLLLAATWVIRPIERLTAYARAVRDGVAAKPPHLPGRTLAELGTAFEQMRDALEGRQHAQRYTQALAHEVKAPLAAIRGAAELLDEDMPAEQRARFLANIRAEGARIQHIVEQLLELSSLEARKALNRTETVPVAPVFAEVVSFVHSAYAHRTVNVTTHVDEGVTVEADRFLLRQALTNLVQNAVEFTPDGGTVAASAAPERGGVAFTVDDTGPGVPEYALPRVFERFYSLPRADGRKSTGIGLALVAEVAHLHGGTAALVNRPEGGARATLWLPATTNRPASRRPATSRP